MLITTQLSTVASQGGGKPAIRYLDKETSYLEFKTHVARLSYLYQKELGHGARVAFLCSNSPAAIESFLALSATRSVSIPMNPALPDDQLATWFKESQATHLAVTSDLLPRARTFVQEHRINAPIIEIEKKHGGEYDPSYTPPPDNVPLETDVILVLRTSGIADKPHLVEFTHKQIYAATVALKRPYHVNATDRFLTSLNWSNPFALQHGILFPLLTGACCVIDHGLEGPELYEFIVKSRVTRLVGLPSYMTKILKLCVEAKSGLPGVKSATVGQSVCVSQLKDAYKALNVRLVEAYGQTENLWTIAMEDTTPDAPTNSLAGFKYKVVNENGDMIEGEDERTGLLCVTSPCSMTRYLMKDKETSDKASKQVLRGTWLYTMDLATLTGKDDNLQIRFRCRKEEALQTEGMYFYPEKVDKALKGCPGVSDIAGFVTKNLQGHRVLVCALVKVAAPPTPEKAILDWCKTKATGDQRPVAFVFVDTIPYTAVGNVNRIALSRQFNGMAT